MNKMPTFSRTALLAGTITFMAPQLHADQTEIDSLKQQLKQLTARLQQLEESAGKPSLAKAPATNTEAPVMGFSGLIELEANYTDHDHDGASSDLIVATVELGVDAALSDNISTSVTLLYEEDDTDLEVDLAIITIANLADTGLNLTLGQTYLPFGAFDSFLVNDTLLLEIAESRETAAIIDWYKDGLKLSAYVFNGDIDKAGNTLENLGASLVWSHSDFGLGVDYISNILDSDGLSAAIENDGVDLDSLEDSAAGYIVRATTEIARVTLLSEYLHAESFSSGNFIDRQLQVMHLEAAASLGQWSLAMAWQETDEAQDILPEQRLSLGASTSLMENLGLGVELWDDKDYSGEHSHNVLVQLNLEF